MVAYTEIGGKVMKEKTSIFIVDDDVDFAESMSLMLEGKNCEVKVVHSGDDAISKFRDQDFDITFMDVRMPGKNGVESFLEIRKFKPNARVVMMTAYSVNQLLDEAIENGAWGVLHKPFDMEHVLEMLNKIKPYGILIADDDPDFVNSILEMLEANGYTVYTAHDGKEAVERIKSDGIDVLILDLRMPLLSGLEAYAELKKSGHTVPTIIVTAYAKEETETLDRLQTLSITGILTKPFDPKVLTLAIEDLTKS
jgi:CheY-like chemotaxis protein